MKFLINIIYKQIKKIDIKKIDERNIVLEKFHLGCFKDDQNDRDLIQYLWSSKTNTIETCIIACREQGFRFAGLQVIIERYKTYEISCVSYRMFLLKIFVVIFFYCIKYA